MDDPLDDREQYDESVPLCDVCGRPIVLGAIRCLECTEKRVETEMFGRTL